ncbi:MAG: AAC(3) family N-acetyltransferase, partial [Candidatus Latescibacteria bacterium]|nr:AAC(3) family N-acetyltransferase [Candidatus Latescibacterota bacterium]
RFQTPLAGVCIDTLGAKPEVCDGRLSWRATIPMSATFVDWVGEAIIRAVLRLHNPGYRLVPGPFVSTSDTLIGDPKYGFPCPWITTHYRKKGVYTAYHSSADTIDLLSLEGLAACAASMAGYLYYLANAGSREVTELATGETERTLKRLRDGDTRSSPAEVRYLLDAHRVSINRLKRWIWGGNRSEILSHLGTCERRVREAAGIRAKQGMRRRIMSGADRIPRRIAPLSPTLDNTPPPIAERIRASKLSAWALFWADGNRRLTDIAEAISCEQKMEVTIEQVTTFFDAHAELGYVELIEPKETVSRKQLIADLKVLGLKRGMDVMVHSSLSKIGHVIGGADAVVDALLSVIGKRGTLMMPSFNHGAAFVFNPMTTPTTNGTIPDAVWRHPEAVRSLHPTHPVAAIGQKAEVFCHNHLEGGIWEQDSPIGKLIHSGGFILSLGVTHDATTAYHVAENSVPCRCIDPFGSNDYIVEQDGTVRQVKGLAFRSGPCPIPPSQIGEALDERGLQRHGMVGRARATFVKAIDLWTVHRALLKDECPTCTIQPRSRR